MCIALHFYHCTDVPKFVYLVVQPLSGYLNGMARLSYRKVVYIDTARTTADSAVSIPLLQHVVVSAREKLRVLICISVIINEVEYLFICLANYDLSLSFIGLFLYSLLIFILVI